MKRSSIPRPRRRPRVEATLARFEAMDPETLDAEQRRYRNFAIRALCIELELRARGLIGADGSPRPRAESAKGGSPSESKPAPSKRTRSRPRSTGRG